ncbi:hypothetical protein TSUD_291780 [Trifolium subterraneum]|uniref:Uncharacterized protein n=1 Tax=Trifolium subterraneum TaxID=3900 RepID=A0A2Z6P1X5_TRISU|nr:hypothetical protein TSUD_291780 [Trifolium subterraneum]
MSSAVFKLLLLLGHLVEPVPQQHLSLPLSEQDLLPPWIIKSLSKEVNSPVVGKEKSDCLVAPVL